MCLPFSATAVNLLVFSLPFVCKFLVQIRGVELLLLRFEQLPRAVAFNLMPPDRLPTKKYGSELIKLQFLSSGSILLVHKLVVLAFLLQVKLLPSMVLIVMSAATKQTPSIFCRMLSGWWQSLRHYWGTIELRYARLFPNQNKARQFSIASHSTCRP